MFGKMRLLGWGVAIAVFGFVSPAFATCTVPHTLTNGQVADASQVMDNFNAVADCADQALSNPVTATGTPANGAIAVFTGSKTITSSNLTGDVTTSGGTATLLSNTGVTAGVYLNPTLSIDAKGRITAAQSGSSGSGGSGIPTHPPSTLLFTYQANGGSAATTAQDGTRYYRMLATDSGAGGGDRARFRGKAVPNGS